jgi:hypothetical protein
MQCVPANKPAYLLIPQTYLKIESLAECEKPRACPQLRSSRAGVPNPVP